MLKDKLEMFWAVFEDDHETALEVCTMFCSYVPELFNEIDDAINSNNKEVALQKIHSLKGTLGYLGFEDETNDVRQLETNINNTGLAPNLHRYSSFKESLNKLVAMLKVEVLKE